MRKTFLVFAMMLAVSAAHAQQPQSESESVQQLVRDWTMLQGILGHVARDIITVTTEMEKMRADLAAARAENATLKTKQKDGSQ